MGDEQRQAVLGLLLEPRLQQLDALESFRPLLALVELVGEGDRLRLQPERLADPLRGFGRPPHRAGEELGDPEVEVAQPDAGRDGLGAAALGQLVAELLGEPLLAGVGVVARLAVAQEEDPHRGHSAAGAAPATTLTKFSRWRVVQHSKVPSQ